MDLSSCNKYLLALAVGLKLCGEKKKKKVFLGIMSELRVPVERRTVSSQPLCPAHGLLRGNE